jgi:type VI secretion system secreted protein VgrG
MDAYEQVRDISQGMVQNDRLLKLDTPLGKNVLLPLRALGQSRIGRDYGFTVDMVSTSRTLELKQLIAQPVTLWIRQNDRTYQPHHGYVHTARRLGSDGGLVHTQLEFASWLHFLRFRKDARIWQDKTVLDILADVFNAHPQARGRFRFNLYGPLKTPLAPRSFCMQYEDDWTFVHRLLESEGLWGYFEQAEDGQSHTLVITDYNYFANELKPGQIHFSRSAMDAEVDGFSHWSGTRTLQSVRYTGVTGDYKAPLRSSTQSKDTVPNQGALPEQTEVYEYTGKYTWPDGNRGAISRRCGWRNTSPGRSASMAQAVSVVWTLAGILSSSITRTTRMTRSSSASSSPSRCSGSSRTTCRRATHDRFQEAWKARSGRCARAIRPK